MFRKIICTLSAMLWLLVLELPAQASQPEGTIRVCPDWGGDLVIGGKVVLYRVGEPVEGGYRLTDGLADWTIWEDDVFSEDAMEWILRQERREEMVRSITDEQGAFFTGLRDGLYLGVQEEPAAGFTAFSPVLIRMPEGQQRELCVTPQVLRDAEPPKTADHPAPIIGAMGLGFSVAVLMVLIDGRKK